MRDPFSGCRVIAKCKVVDQDLKSGGGRDKICTGLIMIPFCAYLAISNLQDLKLSLRLKIGRVSH